MLQSNIFVNITKFKNVRGGFFFISETFWKNENSI